LWYIKWASKAEWNKDLVEKTKNGYTNSISKIIKDLSKNYDKYLKKERISFGFILRR